ncbi:GTP-binding protein (I) alpha subunit [Reticulomyxa filosa]|uniref:GTP-binding protein (I) alpha subunit n=1 Tax=Reticulomyxa filosa TaxID=46433 RepID=X6NAG4_RETFI|nr:GTP-binding protein (I) alpha subunit [Reticulomyxa filosa]|eukprot:ETO23290.1 GTP-binding protein (I) alpha subunit [Reticulomyxa filosa]
MGCVCSNENAERDKNLREHKVLVLGTAGSGKSTIFKSLKETEGKEMIEPRMIVQTTWKIRQTLLEFMKWLIKHSQSLYETDKEKNIDCLIDETTEISTNIQSLMKTPEFVFTENEELSEEDLITLGKTIAYLWKLPSIQATFAKRIQFANEMNMEYFYERAIDIMHPKYFATKEDLLKARVRTTGQDFIYVFMYLFYIHKKVNCLLRLVDIGGLRHGQKTWIDHREDLSTVLFVVALNHYNCVLFEDNTKNAMHEALATFFLFLGTILFLNKRDLFREQLRKVPLSVCFRAVTNFEYVRNDREEEQWKGMNYNPKESEHEQHFERCYNQALEFIRNLFQSRQRGKIFSCYVTCATDQDNISRVFWDVTMLVGKNNLKDML